MARLVEHAHTAARTFGDFEAEQAGTFVLTAGRECPDLAGFERFVADAPWLCNSGEETNFSTPSAPKV